MTGRLRMELIGMGITTDIFYKNEFVRDAIRDAVRDAEANMLRALLEKKFGKLPKWADERLGGATSVQIERWSKKILSAETVEGVLGRK